MRWFIVAVFLVFLAILIPASEESQASSDFVVYSVYRGLNLGNPNEKPQKDYYVNMGMNHGLREGMILKVYRHTPTYDLTADQLYRDVTFPIALIKVIHVESVASIARLQSFLPSGATPAISPRAIFVGDAVRAVK